MTSPTDSSRHIPVLDLFAGAGGMSAGFRDASERYSTVRAVEMDTAAASTYAHNHGPDKVFAGRIEEWLEQEPVPHAEVVIGGPPCQGFSTLGKQDAEDLRNFLWRHYAETVRRAQPKFFVVENVAAFAKSPQFDDFLRETSPGGMLPAYSFDHRILNAADYGAPQARKRAVIIGWRDDQSNPGFPQATHGPSRELPYVTVKDAFTARNVVSRVERTELPAGRATNLVGKMVAGPYVAAEMHVKRNYSDLSMRRFKAIKSGGNRFQIKPEDLSACWRKHTTGSADVMGRLHWTKPSVTIRTEFFKPEKGRYIHPEEHRAITHYEAAILQGFPEEYGFMGSKVEIARQIGNAVPIPLGAALGKHLLQFL